MLYSMGAIEGKKSRYGEPVTANNRVRIIPEESHFKDVDSITIL
jgi:hypothetical protein